MSATITFTGNSSVLTSNFYPELEFDPSCSYSCGLLEFMTYNSIPNVTELNNKVYYTHRKTVKTATVPSNALIPGSGLKPKMAKGINKIVAVPEPSVEKEEETVTESGHISLPIGAYEFKDIASYLTNAFKEKGVSFKIEVSAITLKATVKSSAELFFDKKDSIHRNFGFNDCIIPANTPKTSDNTVSITTLNTIVIECDIVHGSFTNGKHGYSIHEFYPDIEHGFKIIEIPKHIVYLPLNRNTFQSIQISIVDQDRKPIDFRGEKISCRIHIRKD